MSYSYNRRKKVRKSLRTDEHKAISRDIRNGKFPVNFLPKDGPGTNRLERKLVGRKRKLTWRIVSSLKALLGLSKDNA